MSHPFPSVAFWLVVGGWETPVVELFLGNKGNSLGPPNLLTGSGPLFQCTSPLCVPWFHDGFTLILASEAFKVSQSLDCVAQLRGLRTLAFYTCS